MRNRLTKARPHSPADSPSFGIHQDTCRVTSPNSPAPPAPNDSPRATLAPASVGLMNSRSMANGSGPHRDSKPLPSVPAMSGSAAYASQNGLSLLPRRRSTIRAVPSLDERRRTSFDDGASSEGSPSLPRHSNSAFSSPADSNGSALSLSSQPQFDGNKPPSVAIKQNIHVAPSETPTPTVDALAHAHGPIPPQKSNFDIPRRESSLGVTGKQANSTHMGLQPAVGALPHDTSLGDSRHHEDDQGHVTLSPTDAQLANGWDSTIGKAGLGKTGRVINRLVSDNEALKRDLKIERLKGEESRQAARLLEDKMDRLVSDYESRLLEANVTKTLLSRKERQVESLRSNLDLEKKRAVDAQDRERTWREEMEKVRAETKRQVESAGTHATLMESRYNAISSHWRDQGDEVKRAMVRMGKEIQALLEERQRDDERILVLRDLCDQQDGNIRDLRQQKDDIMHKFEDYKDEQENALSGIKLRAAEREAQQEQTLEESREVLDKLKWALQVKSNIEWAS